MPELPPTNISQAVSLPLGCVRLTERFVPDVNAPFPATARTAIAAHTRAALEHGGFRFGPPGGRVVFTGGSMTTVRAIFAARKNLPLLAYSAEIGVPENPRAPGHPRTADTDGTPKHSRFSPRARGRVSRRAHDHPGGRGGGRTDGSRTRSTICVGEWRRRRWRMVRLPAVERVDPNALSGGSSNQRVGVNALHLLVHANRPAASRYCAWLRNFEIPHPQSGLRISTSAIRARGTWRRRSGGFWRRRRRPSS